MRKHSAFGFLALILALVLVGCSAGTEPLETFLTEITEISSAELTNSTEKLTDEPTGNQVDFAKNEEEKRIEEEAHRKAEEDEEKRFREQRNSFSMMYYLAIKAEEIRTSKDNRLVLEDIYTSLLNDINPGAIDEITQDHLKNLRDIIKKYMNISAKRERLQFIYNQEKAAAIRSSVPNPLTILTVANAFNWKKLAITVAYTAIDSYNNYKKAGESADLAFVMSGWELDDEEKEAVMKNRDRAFDYMVDMVQEYDLDGLKTLNEQSIERYTEICATENPAERVRLLKAEETTYALLGDYWLQLAEAYFETSQYSKCVESVQKYNELSTGIYRKDYNYLRILPKVIVAAQAIYNGEEYVTHISEFADAIIANTNIEDWSNRYFAAQVYLDLYSKTQSRSYLEKAYNIASENVTSLLKNQREINAAYMKDIVEQTVTEPDYSSMNDAEKKEAEKANKEEQKKAKEYNKALKEARKTELPSMYEPLVLNCKLLFSLADKLNISQEEKDEIEAILKTETNGIFVVKPINEAFSFSNTSSKYSVSFSDDEIIIPADLMSAGSKIQIIVSEGKSTTTINDCKVSKVKRNGDAITDFDVYVSSKQLKNYEWTNNSKIKITITYSDAYNITSTYNFAVKSYSNHWYGDKVEFEAK